MFHKLILLLSFSFLCSVLLILAEHSNGNNINNLNNLNNLNMINTNNNNNYNFIEEENVAECTRCGDSRLVGCMRGKCYYRCYRRCTLGNLTYQEALRFTLPGY